MLLALSMGSFGTVLAGDKDKKKEPKDLSTMVTTAQPQAPFEDVGFIYFSQEKETSLFGSDTQASLKATVKHIEDRARELGADKVVGFTIIVGPPGEFRFIGYGTAIKWIHGSAGSQDSASAATTTP